MCRCMHVFVCVCHENMYENVFMNIRASATVCTLHSCASVCTCELECVCVCVCVSVCLRNESELFDLTCLQSLTLLAIIQSVYLRGLSWIWKYEEWVVAAHVRVEMRHHIGGDTEWGKLFFHCVPDVGWEIGDSISALLTYCDGNCWKSCATMYGMDKRDFISLTRHSWSILAAHGQAQMRGWVKGLCSATRQHLNLQSIPLGTSQLLNCQLLLSISSISITPLHNSFPSRLKTTNPS